MLKKFDLGQPFHNGILSRIKQANKFTEGVYDQWFICEKCEGSGKYSFVETKSNTLECPTCKGEGKILMRFRTKRVR